MIHASGSLIKITSNNFVYHSYDTTAVCSCPQNANSINYVTWKVETPPGETLM